MHVSLMQFVDYWAGIPLCFLATIVAYLGSVFARRAANFQPRKLLFIELSEMGSAVIAYSSICRAKELFPQAELYFLIFRRNRESVDLLNIIPEKNVLVIEDRSLWSFLLSFVRTLLSIRRIGIDVTFDLELFSRCTALISWLTGARYRVGFHQYTAEGLYRGRLFTHYVLYNPHQHMSLNFLALVNALERPSNERPLVKSVLRHQVVALPEVIPTVDEDARIDNILKQHLSGGLGSEQMLILVNPDPGLLTLRGWPIQRFAEACGRLAAHNPAIVIGIVGLLRSKGHAAVIRESVGSDRCIDLSGETRTLRELVVLMRRARVLLTNDSGPAHMASLTPARIVTLFGPETPALYGPMGPRAVSLFAGLSCSPCYAASNHRRSACTNNVCMQEITVDQVCGAVNDALRG